MMSASRTRERQAHGLDIAVPGRRRYLQVDRVDWAKESYEYLGFVYASGVSVGPTVGQIHSDQVRELMLEPARQDMVQGSGRQRQPVASRALRRSRG